MADAAPAAGAPAGGAPAGASRGGFGSRGGDRGRGRGRGRGRRGGGKSEEKEWQPVTKLGRLVKAGKIKSMEEIYLHSLPIKEFQIVDFFLPKLKDEVMKVCVPHRSKNACSLFSQIKPVQKQTRAGQRTRFKAIVVIGDSEGHIGLGIKTSKEVATAIRAAIIIAKLSVVPIRRGYWGSNLGEPHSLPVKESGKCGSVTVRVRTFAFLGGENSNILSLFLLLVVLASSLRLLSSASSNLPVCKTHTLRLLALPKRLKTP
jgi:small subunit ribosomal protein S2e